MEFKIGQEVKSILGSPMIVVKITKARIKCEYVNKSGTGKPCWSIYKIGGKPYKRLMKDNNIV